MQDADMLCHVVETSKPAALCFFLISAANIHLEMMDGGDELVNHREDVIVTLLLPCLQCFIISRYPR